MSTRLEDDAEWVGMRAPSEPRCRARNCAASRGPAPRRRPTMRMSRSVKVTSGHKSFRTWFNWSRFCVINSNISSEPSNAPRTRWPRTSDHQIDNALALPSIPRKKLRPVRPNRNRLNEPIAVCLVLAPDDNARGLKSASITSTWRPAGAQVTAVLSG
jgi:hypothetical protein